MKKYKELTLYPDKRNHTLYPPPKKKRKKKSHTPNNKTNYNLDIITMIYEDEVISKSPTEESIRTGHRKMSCMHSIHRHLYSPSPQQWQQKYSYNITGQCLFVCVCVYFLQIQNAFKNYNKMYLDERGWAKHIFKQIINCKIFFFTNGFVVCIHCIYMFLYILYKRSYI